MENSPTAGKADAAGAPSGRGVLEGAFALLEELARVGEAGLTDLATGAGLPKATAHRLLHQLAAVGAVERRAHRYRMGPAIARLDRSGRLHRLLDRASAVPLRHLAQATGSTVCVVAPSAGDMTVIAGIPGAAREVFPHLPGQTLPPDSAADVVLAASRRAAGPPPGLSSAQWTRRLNRAREYGADIHQYEWDGERICLAAPVHAPSGLVVAAVGVAVPDPRDLPATVESTQRAARMLSTHMHRLAKAQCR
ncbi:helix-turn-helix domain-containing protein [Streptomyces sp. NPDC059002]|uniref:helix-turn-helix domain-containing protein n=1 Tax=Streptomyces sp. NPDC059002 TaxID=3346690 RepID=UPI0036D10314